MNGHCKISQDQLFALMLNFLLASAFILIPSSVIAGAKQDGWLSIVVSLVAVLLPAWIYSTFPRLFPGQTIVQVCRTLLGPKLGGVAGWAFVWFALHLGALVVRNFGDFLTVTLMPETSRIALQALPIAVVAMALSGGLEVFCRFNGICAVLVVPSVVVFLLLSLTIRHIQAQKLLPLLEGGWGSVLKTALVPLTFPFGETVLFTMVAPYMHKQENAWHVWIASLVAGSTMLVLATVAVTAVFGPQGGARLYSVHSLARCISIGSFVERIDALPVIIWVLSGFTKIAVCLYAFVLGSAQLLGLKDHRPLILPSGVIIVSLAMLVYDDITQQIDFARYTWPVYSLPFEFGLPFILWLLARSRQRSTSAQGR